jgi:peptidoglycan-N-acetylmuramic acid deacetylase
MLRFFSEKKRNYAFAALFAFAFCFIALTTPSNTPVSATHTTTKCYDWYFKPAKNNVQPEVIPEAKSFIDKYDTWYLGSPNDKVLYLTFDAGFDNGYHEKILDVLKKQNIPATFFVDGNFVKTKPDLVNRIISEGHILGNHSLNHPDMTKKTEFEDFKKQITGWEELVKTATGGKEGSKFFRPPMGKFSELSLQYTKELGYRTVFWSFAYADWEQDKQPEAEYAKRIIKARVHNGCVMLLHSTSRTNAVILDDLLTELKSEGYRFDTLYSLTNSYV